MFHRRPDAFSPRRTLDPAKSCTGFGPDLGVSADTRRSGANVQVSKTRRDFEEDFGGTIRENVHATLPVGRLSLMWRSVCLLY